MALEVALPVSAMVLINHALSGALGPKTFRHHVREVFHLGLVVQKSELPNLSQDVPC